MSWGVGNEPTVHHETKEYTSTRKHSGHVSRPCSNPQCGACAGGPDEPPACAAPQPYLHPVDEPFDTTCEATLRCLSMVPRMVLDCDETQQIGFMARVRFDSTEPEYTLDARGRLSVPIHTSHVLHLARTKAPDGMSILPRAIYVKVSASNLPCPFAINLTSRPGFANGRGRSMDNIAPPKSWLPPLICAREHDSQVGYCALPGTYVTPTEKCYELRLADDSPVLALAALDFSALRAEVERTNVFRPHVRQDSDDSVAYYHIPDAYHALMHTTAPEPLGADDVGVSSAWKTAALLRLDELQTMAAKHDYFMRMGLENSSGVVIESSLPTIEFQALTVDGLPMEQLRTEATAFRAAAPQLSVLFTVVYQTVPSAPDV